MMLLLPLSGLDDEALHVLYLKRVEKHCAILKPIEGTCAK